MTRAGERRRVPSSDLVPGDLVLLQSGDKVPANLGSSAPANCSSTSRSTGESLAVEKSTAPVWIPEAVLADRTNMAYSSTLVVSGQGRGVVTATGDRTEIGRISELIASAETLSTPLTRRIAAFSRVFLYVAACTEAPVTPPISQPTELVATSPILLIPTVTPTIYFPETAAPTEMLDTSQTGFHSRYFPPTDLEDNWDPFTEGLTMVYIPAGDFLMGSPKLSAASYDERPQRKIFLDGFWIDRTEVTNEKFVVFLNEMGNQKQGRATWLDAGSEYARIQQQDGKWQVEAGYERHPVVEVSWFGASSYCQWAGMRLPTEAEWEKAARGVDERTFPWGEMIDCTLANYKGCLNTTARVGSLPIGASPYGVLDMAGNSIEWVADWYAEDTYSLPPVPNPLGPQTGNTRVMRGGSWLSVGNFLTVTFREKSRPDDSGYTYGFRCAFTSWF